MEIRVKEIAKMLKGTVVGDENIVINSLSKIEQGTKGSLSFLANSKYFHFLPTTKASAILVEQSMKEASNLTNATLIQVEDAYLSFAKIINLFGQENKQNSGIHPSSFVDKDSSVGKDVYIGANVNIGKNCYIGDQVHIYPNCHIGDNVTIGKNTIIYAGTVINSSCQIGQDCFIQSGVVIGSDGFGFANDDNNNFLKIAQIGNVIIEDQVEIGANTTIDRATMGSTIIRQGVKLDNLIQIAHNVEIGRNTIIAAQSGVAGSTKIGENCMIGGQVGIIGHLVIGNNVKIAAQSGVGSNVKDDQIIQGSPAFSVSDYRKSYVSFKQLPQLFSLVHKIEKQINNLLKK